MAATPKPLRKGIKKLKLAIHHSENSPSKKEGGKIMMAHAKSVAKNKHENYKWEKEHKKK